MNASRFFRMVCLLSFLAKFGLNVFAYEIPSNISKEQIAEVQKKIDEINKRNIAEGRKWRAKITPQSFYTVEEMRGICGTKVPEERRKIMVGNKENTILPKPIRGVMKTASVPNWIDYMGPVADQETCGNCYVHGTCGVVEALIQYRYGEKMDQELTDGLFLNKGYLTTMAPGNCQQGGWPVDVFSYIYNHRAPALNLYGTGNYYFPNYDNAFYGISSYTDHGETNIAEIKTSYNTVRYVR